MPTNLQETVFIMVEGDNAAEGLAKFAGPQEISVEKLREHLQSFVGKIGGALSGVASAIGNYELAGVEVEASFNAEKGFIFIAKAGIEGSVKLRFEKRHQSAK
jgi:hypothetical protein